jgi:hypothetical protein
MLACMYQAVIQYVERWPQLTFLGVGFFFVATTGFFLVATTGFFVGFFVATTGFLVGFFVAATAFFVGFFVAATGFLVATTGFLVTATGFFVGFFVTATGFFVGFFVATTGAFCSHGDFWLLGCIGAAIPLCTVSRCQAKIALSMTSLQDGLIIRLRACEVTHLWRRHRSGRLIARAVLRVEGLQAVRLQVVQLVPVDRQPRVIDLQHRAASSDGWSSTVAAS